MSLLQLLCDLAAALRYWLSIKAVRARWELQRDIASNADEYEDAIFAARSSGEHDRADVLLRRLTRNAGFSTPVNELPPAGAGGSTPGNKSGNVGFPESV
ncbi:MAG: hypothetical protein WCO60_19765 [Verrucomicrobiota bacterium]